MKKYIVKESLAKEVLVKANFLKARANQLKQTFKFLFDNGFPSFWNEKGIMIPEKVLAAFWLDLSLLVLRSNKPLDRWPFQQQAVKQPAISPKVTYGGT